jgi:hypothetical protein
MDGSGVPGFNILPSTRTTIEMNDGAEETNERTRATRIEEYKGVVIASHTTGIMYTVTTPREPALATLPFTAPPRNTPRIGRPPTPPPPIIHSNHCTRTRSLSPRRITRQLNPEFMKGQKGRVGLGRGGEQMLTVTRSQDNWARFLAMLQDFQNSSQGGHRG